MKINGKQTGKLLSRLTRSVAPLTTPELEELREGLEFLCDFFSDEFAGNAPMVVYYNMQLASVVGYLEARKRNYK